LPGGSMASKVSPGLLRRLPVMRAPGQVVISPYVMQARPGPVTRPADPAGG
jgi:hypothetical protein